MSIDYEYMRRNTYSANHPHRFYRRGVCGARRSAQYLCSGLSQADTLAAQQTQQSQRFTFANLAWRDNFQGQSTYLPFGPHRISRHQCHGNAFYRWSNGIRRRLDEILRHQTGTIQTILYS